MASVRHLEELARFVRRSILTSTTAAGSGHPTSSLSAVELMVGLLFGGQFRADLNRPNYPGNDRLIFSKGHAAPLLYALYHVAGKVSRRELLRLRKFGSLLEGHPMPGWRYTEAPTGSLGQGLSVGLGIAMAATIDRQHYQTYVLLGDSEMAEGSIWEALMLAGHQRQGNLSAILDCNRLGQSGPTMLGHNLRTYARRVQSFGWRTIVIDGHNLQQVISAYRQLGGTDRRPTMIIAKTIKGKGVSFIENRLDWHGKALTTKELGVALKEVGPVDHQLKGIVRSPRRALVQRPGKTRVAPQRRYKIGEVVAPRKALALALTRLVGRQSNVVVLDGDVQNSTGTDMVRQHYPHQFIQGYIAEQNIAGLALGLATRGKVPVAATFAAFWTRAFDQIRMSQYAGTHEVFIGTHPGVHIGADGASQMALEDIAMWRALDNATILYPADAVAAERLLERAVRSDGLVYIRTTRAELPVIYRADQRFVVGGSATLRKSSRDTVTLVAAGVTVHEALAAADLLKKSHGNTRVIDLYSVQPIDVTTLRRAARETKRLIVVEDHRAGGGLGEAVRSAIGPFAGVVTSLAVHKTPRSGRPDELLRHQRLDAAAIVEAVRRQGQ